MNGVQRIDGQDGVALAFSHCPGSGPTLVFLPGYMSDMQGTKVLALEDFARRTGRAALRLDYSGCGQSGGRFEDGSIRRWAADAIAVIEAVAPGPLILIGSSMGGWIMLHVALALGARVQAMVGIAAAPDFTRWGLSLSNADHGQLERHGYVSRESAYGPEPYRYWRALLDDAEGACLLDAEIAIDCPVRLLHGQQDADVPFGISLRLAERLRSQDVQTVLVKSGDHRLSTPEDLHLLFATIEGLLAP
jgi:pimeloyl-ACP methyl ester carboxylesterase